MKAKLIVAILIAVVGVTLAVRTFWPASSNRAKPAPSEEVSNPSEQVEELLTGTYDTVPTEETIEADIRRAEARAESVLMAARLPSMNANQRADLADAFRERLESVINPDYMRDLRARVARGQPVEIKEPTPEQLEQSNSWKEHFALLPIDIQSLEVRPIYQRGAYVAESMTAKGFGEGTTKLGGATAFPMSELDPVEDKLDIVEVRLPMEVPVPVGRDDETRERNLVGFQFVWSRERQQWIPWVIKNYGNPNRGVFGLPF